MTCAKHGEASEFGCVKCAIEHEPMHFKLGRVMAQTLRDKFGDGAEAVIPRCKELAMDSGDWLQVETVRMAEKFLIGRKPSGGVN